jgi:hypothetical protein
LRQNTLLDLFQLQVQFFERSNNVLKYILRYLSMNENCLFLCSSKSVICIFCRCFLKPKRVL